MKISLKYGEEIFALPSAIMNYIDKAPRESIVLLLTLASDKELRENASVTELSKRLAISEKELEGFIDFWVSSGVIEADKGAKGKRASTRQKKSDNGVSVTVVQNEGSVSYTGAEIEKIFEERSEIALAIDECAKIIGKIFSASEMSKIIALFDYLSLEPEYVIMLFSYCKSIDRPSVHYIEKLAYSLYNEGVITYTALEEYLSAKERLASFEGRVRTLMGLGTRALTAREKKFISLWCDMSLPYEMIELAYEITVNNTQSPSMPYMNKVLSNWREAGYKSVDDVNEAMESYKRKKESSSGSFDTDEFLEAALERSFRESEERGKK